MSKEWSQEDQITIQNVLDAVAVLSYSTAMHGFTMKDRKNLKVIARISFNSKERRMRGIYVKAALTKIDPAFSTMNHWRLTYKHSAPGICNLAAAQLVKKYPDPLPSKVGKMEGSYTGGRPGEAETDYAYMLLKRELGMEPTFQAYTVILQAEATAFRCLQVPANSQQEADALGLVEPEQYISRWEVEALKPGSIKIRREEDSPIA